MWFEGLDVKETKIKIKDRDTECETVLLALFLPGILIHAKQDDLVLRAGEREADRSTTGAKEWDF